MIYCASPGSDPLGTAPRATAAPLSVHRHRPEDLCVVAPAPELRDKLLDQFERLRNRAAELVGRSLTLSSPTHVGLNDGLIYPGTYYPVGTSAAVAQRAALERAPLRGAVRVAVVLVDFSDKAMAAGAATRFNDLFFSTGTVPNGSVKEYFADVSGGLIDIQGTVVGPYRMPQTLAAYAGADNGMQGGTPNARTLANDAVTAADPHVNFAPYDNDGNGYVDAFIVVHAGRGAEETGAASDIWSHKWVLPAERSVDGAKIYAYLTIPEDAKVGVSAHELGHLVFGWPDLYDTDYSSEGIGNWCLMAGGSWGLGGDRPVHPSAWCKATQGWINVITQTTNADITITDVKTSRNAYRLWKDGAGGNEYFLVENRQQVGFDASLPGQGLLIWHIDEATAGNSNESHYKVALMQADGLRQLEGNVNRGDGGDPFPGSTGNASFTDTSTPNSKSYAGATTEVSVTAIPASATAMPVHVTVKAGIVKPFKELKDRPKENIKEFIKERPKELIKEGKEIRKDIIKERPKELIKEGKEFKEFKERPKEIVENKFGDNKLGDNPGLPGRVDQANAADVEARISALEQSLNALAAALVGDGADWGPGGEPFIGADERPRLGVDLGQPDWSQLRAQMEAGSAEAKAIYDNLPPS
jgi:immune inhibitor A